MDEVLFIPAGEPWQKGDQAITASHHRLAMVDLAIAGNPKFASSRIEIDRAGPSFTIDTVRDLASDSVDLFLILGEDAYAGIDSWHEAEELTSMVHFAVCTRPGTPAPVVTKGATVVPIPQVDISSTMIRNRIRNNQSIQYLTPESVIRYAYEHQLYRDES